MEEWDNSTLTIKLKILCKSVEGLKKLYKPVWGGVGLIVVLGVLIGIGAAVVSDTNASVGEVRELHIKEYRDMENSIKQEINVLEDNINKSLYVLAKDSGRNEASHIEISTKLDNIDERLREMAIWMREHK